MKAIVFAAAAGLLCSGPVLAQALVDTPTQGEFNRSRTVAVTQRTPPGYEPYLVPLGSFTLLPILGAGLEENDNIYAQQYSKRSDTIGTISPELDLRSTWSRNFFQAFARLPTREYVRYSGESTTDWQGGASGRLDVGNGAIAAGGDVGLLTEPRTSNLTTQNTAHPVRFMQSDFFVGGAQEFGRIRLSTRYDFQRDDYDNGIDSSGFVVLEKYRTFDSHRFSGKAEYALSPRVAVYLNGSYNLQRYDLPTSATNLNRDSEGGLIALGTSFELSALLRGQLQIGYLNQTFKAPLFSALSGLSAQGKVEWFPTQLTTVTLTGSRAVQDSGLIGSSAYIAEIAGLQLDHELLRNLILTGRAIYEDDSFNGIIRKDHSITGYAGARYLMNRLVSLNVGYNYQQLSSKGSPLVVGQQYTVTRLVVGTELAF